MVGWWVVGGGGGVVVVRGGGVVGGGVVVRGGWWCLVGEVFVCVGCVDCSLVDGGVVPASSNPNLL